MSIDLIKDIANLTLTGVLAIATVYLTYFTSKLVNEARKSRKAQAQPSISVHIENAEIDPTLLYVVVKNIGIGTAYNLTFDFEKDIGDYDSQICKLSDRGLFDQGMHFCPPGFLKRYFLMETTSEYAAKMKEEIKFKADYQNVFNENFSENFHLRLSENKKHSKITPSDTYIGRISESLESIKNQLEKR